ncbi:MAG: septal ring lytic transglycosylase RlpA family protein [Alphaproteobacteria bacterium]|nr:septal ring lytic transglycosylase RlpA family protein [Alphaproteobacteria bacterium]
MQLRGMRVAVVLGVCLALGGCAQTQLANFVWKRSTTAPTAPPSGGTYKVGTPYVINGVRYEPKEDPNYNQTGIASWYGHPFHGQRTANGDVYNMHAMTAAHQTLPMPSHVRVTNLENGRSVILTVNDRGPFVRGRIIDVSYRAAQLLGFAEKGTAMIRVEAVPSASENMIATRGAVAPEARPLGNAGPPVVQVAAAPRPTVAVETLPPVQGVALAPQPIATPRLAVGTLPPEVTLMGVPSVNRIYVQAGAFASYESANAVRLSLASLGPVAISTVEVAGRPLYRVRVGPIDTVPRAETTLAMVVARGHTEARILVD